MKKKILYIFIAIFMLFIITSCTSGIDEEDMIIIDNIQAEVLTDGRTKVTISYQNEDKEADVFYIPKGNDGTGIKDIVYKINEETNTTDIIFTFTDTLNDYTVSVANGRGISNILYTLDDVIF